MCQRDRLPGLENRLFRASCGESIASVSSPESSPRSGFSVRRRISFLKTYPLRFEFPQASPAPGVPGRWGLAWR
jgi:hypothetical protein